MACLFFFDWGALLGARGCLQGSCSDDGVLQEELCFRRRAEMIRLIRLPRLLLDGNHSVIMYRVVVRLISLCVLFCAIFV